MRDGKLKLFLYRIRIIPVYSYIKQFNYDRKKRIMQKSDRWFYRFLPIKKNKIVFDNIVGSGYGENLKAIVDEILKQELDVEIVWLVRQKYDMPTQIRQVKYGSPEAMYELTTAKMWVFNCRFVKHPKKKKKQVYLQTWHGAFPLKKIEKDAEDYLGKEYVRMAKYDGSITDGVLIDNRRDEEIFRRAFWLKKGCEYLKFGIPRTDVLINKMNHCVITHEVRSSLGISDDAYVILYAPTFRDSGSEQGYIKDFDRILKTISSKQKNAFILVRMHPLAHHLAQKICCQQKLIINATDYSDIQGLIIAANCLISDYSSIMFDFAIMKKPVFLYAKDYNEYLSQSRPFYDEINMLPFSISFDEEGLINNINKYNEDEYQRRLCEFYQRFPNYNDGLASKKTVEWIESKITKKVKVECI